MENFFIRYIVLGLIAWTIIAIFYIIFALIKAIIKRNSKEIWCRCKECGCIQKVDRAKDPVANGECYVVRC